VLMVNLYGREVDIVIMAFLPKAETEAERD
jgi:hypothetical protein